jgi:hypothetical protein
MLVSVHLFNAAALTAHNRFVEWFKSRLTSLEGAAAGAAQQLVGLYAADIERVPGSRPSAFVLPGPRCLALVKLAEASTVEQAMCNEADARLIDDQISAVTELQAWIDPTDDKRLWLSTMVASRFAFDTMPLDGRLLRIVLRHLPANRTLAELVEFDSRIVDLYANTMAAARWYHIAIHHVLGLPTYMYADAFDVVDAATVDEAMANDAKLPVTPEYQAVLDECNDYLDRSRDRFSMWLTPLVLTRRACDGVRFAGTVDSASTPS